MGVHWWQSTGADVYLNGRKNQIRRAECAIAGTSHGGEGIFVNAVMNMNIIGALNGDRRFPCEGPSAGGMVVTGK